MDQDVLPDTIMPKTSDAALVAFISARTEIDAVLERLAGSAPTTSNAEPRGCELENGGAKVGHSSGGMSLLRVA